MRQWADFAEQHKGTSYKLHVYVAWSKELCDDDGKTTSLSDMEGTALSCSAHRSSAMAWNLLPSWISWRS